MSTKNFEELAQAKPCAGCAAHCCRMLLIPHPTPMNFLDLDYIRYMVAFQNVDMLLDSAGHWQVRLRQTCSLLDPVSKLCTVHDTPRQPKICVNFPATQCWYRRNFEPARPEEVITIDMRAMELLLESVGFDDAGQIVEIPAWSKLKELIERPPTEPAAEVDDSRIPVHFMERVAPQVSVQPRHN